MSIYPQFDMKIEIHEKLLVCSDVYICRMQSFGILPADFGIVKVKLFVINMPSCNRGCAKNSGGKRQA